MTTVDAQDSQKRAPALRPRPLLGRDPSSSAGAGGGAPRIFWWTQGKLREGIGWLEQAREAATDAPAELLGAGLFSEGFLVAHDTDDWFAAARLIDMGIDGLSGHGRPPLILGMLHCLRGECDVFNGDAKSAVSRTQAGLESRRRTRARGAGPFACGTRPTRGWRPAKWTPPSRS